MAFWPCHGRALWARRPCAVTSTCSPPTQPAWIRLSVGSRHSATSMPRSRSTLSSSMRRGRSVTVLGGAETQASLVQLASGLVGAARRLGLNDRAIVKLVKGKL